MNVYVGVTPEQAKRAQIVRDIINGEASALPFARQRAKAFLTPLAARMRIMDELAHLPETRRRSVIRRKLTRLDMALSDKQSAALDRAISAWLTLNGKSRSVDPSAVHAGGGEGAMPLNQREVIEAGEYQKMRKRLEGMWTARLEALCVALAPWREERSRRLSDAEIGLIVNLSSRIITAYSKSC